MRSGKARRGCICAIAFPAFAAVICVSVYRGLTSPVDPGKERFIRFDTKVSASEALKTLEEQGVIRSAMAARIYRSLNRHPGEVAKGTYLVQPGMTLDKLFRSLKTPVRQMVRLPEAKWARQMAEVIEAKGVGSADEYMAGVADPKGFANRFKMPLESAKSLEGYLFPDTYDLPPLIGSRAAIERQLKAFEVKVMPHVQDTGKLYRVLIIASMVELEVAIDKERAMVAGVIENRLAKGMKLDIDACINYALQDWRPLTRKDIAELDSPYNTYKYKGLPPTPICSPSLKSILASIAPARHGYLYYVAMPQKYHLFATTYEEHLRNVARRKRALSELNR